MRTRILLTVLGTLQALQLGEDRVGIIGLLALGFRLRLGLSRGYEGGMGWMERRAAERADPRRVVPGARSVVSVALNYFTPHHHTGDPLTGKVSRYAWGEDYHQILGEKLSALWGWMRETFPGAEGKWYVDTWPVMEKVLAERAGVGWIGKHTNLITREMGSWVFLGEILTTLELVPDAPATDHCGTCTLCIEACPTGAIVEPYVLDARLCLSYLTIEHKKEVEGDITSRYDGWVFGCDVCQDVCPWNHRFAVPSGEARFEPRNGITEVPLDEWAAQSPEEFARRTEGSPLRRAGFEGMQRNIRILQRGGASPDSQ